MTALRPGRPAALFDDTGTPIRLGARLSDSGEASVFRHDDDARLLVKLHRAPGPALRAKLAALPALAPPDPTLDERHRNIAWPVGTVRDSAGAAVGCLIPAVPGARSLTALASPKLRARRAADLDWLSLHGIAAHLAFAVGHLHAHGVVIGDLAPENVLVDARARITLIDCDSMQVGDHLCTVGSEGYTAPEWIGRRFDAGPRDETADRFALAVLMYQLLTGAHPWTGEWMGGGDPPPRDRLIRSGDWPFRPGARLRPVPGMVAPDMLGSELAALFRRAFIAGIDDPGARPDAAEWQAAVCLALSALEACATRPHHHYDPSLGACPWCARIDAGLPDPFPAPVAAADPFAPLVLAVRRALARGDGAMALSLWRASPGLARRDDLADLAEALAALLAADAPEPDCDASAEGSDEALRAAVPGVIDPAPAQAPAAKQGRSRVGYRIDAGWPGLRMPALILEGRAGVALPGLELVRESDAAVLLRVPPGRLRPGVARRFEAPGTGGVLRLRAVGEAAVDLDHPAKRNRLLPASA